jgi:hypothetical protein
MSHHEYPIDSALTEELRDSLAELAVPGRPSLAAITGRGRVHRRRRRAGLVGLGGAAAGIALTLGLTGVFGAAPAPGTSTVQSADFTLTSYVNGTVSLKLSQLFDPVALQRALGQHGIPALVKINAYCPSRPAAPNPARLGVWSIGPTPARARDQSRPWPYDGAIMQSMNIPVKPSQLAPFVDPVTVVINPAAIPSGTEVFIGDYDLGHTVFMDLIYTKSHTCINGQKPPPVVRLDRPPSAGHG